MTKVVKVVESFQNGYSCSQAINFTSRFVPGTHITRYPYHPKTLLFNKKVAFASKV